MAQFFCAPDGVRLNSRFPQHVHVADACFCALTYLRENQNENSPSPAVFFRREYHHRSRVTAFMNPERWHQITDIFEAALRRDAAARPAFLAEACSGDGALRAEVE